MSKVVKMIDGESTCDETNYELVAYAINNHDRLTEENKRLRGLLAKINHGDERYIEGGQMFTEIKQLLSEPGGE